ncbi:MAG TPA: gas vesicle protein [Nocardioides sp.]|uniref:gas vesicle protein n=1 Tax=Nocardioides sp. TaxID=35761 RepID=UPI002F3FBF87
MTATQLSARAEGRSGSRETQPIALVDLLDRLLGTGVVLSGDVLISLAGVDLVEIRLRALIRTVREEEQR